MPRSQIPNRASNIHDLRAQVTLHPAKAVELELTCNVNWLADTSASWYRGSSALRTTTPTGQNVRTIGEDSFDADFGYVRRSVFSRV